MRERKLSTDEILLQLFAEFLAAHKKKVAEEGNTDTIKHEQIRCDIPHSESPR